MVEHLTLNQGVQGSNPWRSTASTIFEDIGALGMVLFLWRKTGMPVFLHKKSTVDATDAQMYFTSWRLCASARKEPQAAL